MGMIFCRRVMLTIALIAALTLGTFVLVASAQNPPGPPKCGPNTSPPVPCWPSTTGQKSPVAEWFSDIPWHQKLGTFAGNEIDEAIILPYEALQPDLQASCGNPTDPLKQAACMIETGVNNVLGTLRTDTLYDQSDSAITAAAYCKSAQHASSQPCIQVKLDLSMFWVRTTGCDKLTPPEPSPCLQPRQFGNVNPTGSPPYYGGYSITDGSTYAPQMPWYMSHYCDAQFQSYKQDPKDPQSPIIWPDVQDPVCYADYLSPFNDGFNPFGKGAGDWPNSVPWSVYPVAPAPPAPNNHCQPGLTTCTLVMAGFDLSPVPPAQNNLQYQKYNSFLLTWFTDAVQNFPNNYTQADFYRHFPWSGKPVTWGDLQPQAILNPFLGQFTFKQTEQPVPPSGCDTTLTDPVPVTCTNTGTTRADHYLYPRQCTLADLAGTNIPKLRACGLNYELHHNGYVEEWPNSFWTDISNAGMLGNQYGRTSFLFAGVPGMQAPVSFGNIPGSASGLSVYEQVYNASIFSLYLPIANEADFRRAFQPRNYTAMEFYHTLLMSNHMESDPWEFAEGIRGKVLWHDEYRTEKMFLYYKNNGQTTFPPRTFPAAFDPATAPAPFHNNTCDGCHVRNGSGVPIKPAPTLGSTAYTLDATLQSPQGFMTTATYNPYGRPIDPIAPSDYTFTGQIRPMKLVFFDLQRVTPRNDDSVYSKPLAASSASQGAQVRGAANTDGQDPYYKNTIMNFYGDSFHVSKPDQSNYVGYNFSWNYVSLPATSDRLVVKASRKNPETGQTYQSLQVNLPTGAFVTPGSGCQFVKLDNPPSAWPTKCADINDDAIHAAINGTAPDCKGVPCVGFILLNGKRLGNLGAIEAIPNNAITGFRQNQINALGGPVLGGKLAGEVQWTAGTRGGVDGVVHLNCKNRNLSDCFIGRFGWIGDRVSLNDQVANAAFVEMNMTTKEGYNKLYPKGNTTGFSIRYNAPDCGPADQACVTSGGNRDLSEADIDRMADYARWLGSPTRSDFMVSQPDVIAGEKVFGDMKCNTCHVISKIEIVPDQTMLTNVFVDRLKTRLDKSFPPFLSYLGTDLLMHDMGYLSQVGNLPPNVSTIRDGDGVVLTKYKNFVQKIRTPPLKGLRFNRFVTESQLNTQKSCGAVPYDPDPKTATPCDPGCDFLLHDGRACDAIEAAFLHDGPAIKKLGVIDGTPGCKKNSGNECGLNDLTGDQIRQLRAFLYSL